MLTRSLVMNVRSRKTRLHGLNSFLGVTVVIPTDESKEVGLSMNCEATNSPPIGRTLPGPCWEVLANEFFKMAGVAGLEPVTSAVTGQRSNQLSYTPAPSGAAK